MEKLIELLNEYCKEKKIWEWSMLENGYLFHWNKPIKNKKEEFDLLIISKHYWFIDWLVDNDKIERDKIIEKSVFIPIVCDKVWNLLNPTEEQELLMLLSIQDNPIEFLISILK